MFRSRRALALVVSSIALGCGGSTPPPPPPIATAPPPPSVSAPVVAAPPPRTPPREDPKLVSRDVLFAFPDHVAPSLSPDGKKIAWLAPIPGAASGGLAVWVAPAESIDTARAVTHEKHSVHEVEWAADSNQILYAATGETPDELHVHLLDLAKGEATDLTPVPGVSAHVHRVSPRFPGEALLAINERDKNWFDLVRVDFKTKTRKVVLQNDAHLSTMFVADDFQPRVARRELAGGGAELVELSKGAWSVFAALDADDALTTQPLWLDKTGKTLFLLDSRGRDVAGLVALDLATKKPVVLAEGQKADLTAPLASPVDHKVQAVASLYERLEWTLLDESIRPDFAYLRTLAEGELHVVSRSLDDKRWLVQISPADGPPRFFFYDRAKKHGTKLFSSDKLQENLVFAKTKSEVLTATDGRALVTYLTLPAGEKQGSRPGRPDAPLPMVLLVHGGLWSRDVGVFDPYAEWLSSRGYAVVQVNYRGSAGFGKSHLRAGDHEWGGKMQADLIDAVNWAIREKIADPAKIAIFGGTYGGYATLAALSSMPTTFACGVDIGGPVNLETYAGSIDKAYLPLLEVTARRIGDPRTEDGRKLLAARSPIHRAGAIERPLLIAQGEHDARVPRSDVDPFVQGLLDRQVPVTYAVYGDEAHGLSRAENAKSFSAVAEIFLAQCLGGSYEPIGDDFAGSSLSVLAGAGEIHSLTEALR